MFCAFDHEIFDHKFFWNEFLNTFFVGHVIFSRSAMHSRWILIFLYVIRCQSTWVVLSGPDRIKIPLVSPSVQMKEEVVPQMEPATNIFSENKVIFKENAVYATEYCEISTATDDVTKRVEETDTSRTSSIIDSFYALTGELNISRIYQSKDLIFTHHIPVIRTDSHEYTWQYIESEYSNTEINITLTKQLLIEMRDKFQTKLSVVKSTNKFEWNSTSENKIQTHGPIITVWENSLDRINFEKQNALEFNFNTKNMENPSLPWTCVFWNNTSKTWSTEGVDTNSHKDRIACSSKHLSAFSILLNLHQEKDHEKERILTIISIAGSFITIPCLILTISIYQGNRTRRGKVSAKILIQCCLALLILHTWFLLFNFFKNSISCAVINFFLHFGTSSSLLWTAADGINMWRKLFVDVFDKWKSVFYRWSKIIAWGFPLITSAIGVVVTEYKEKVCEFFFERNYDLIFYSVPCLMIILCNMMFFSIMFTNVICKNKIKSLSGRKKKYVMSLVQVFGLCWCVAIPFFWFQTTCYFGQIMFSLLTSSQGLVIFLVRCLNEKEIRREIVKWAVYRKFFHRVLKISELTCSDRRAVVEVTGVYPVSSDGGRCYTTSSNTDCKI